MDRNRKMSKSTVNKILSLVLAIVLWVVVIGGENPIKDRTITAVPVVLKNLDALTNSNLAIAGDTEYKVDVKIKGQRTVVDPLTTKDITVEADLFGYGIGQNYINVTARIPDNTELVEIRSPKIQVIIEELVAVSKPININFKEVPSGKEVGGILLQPTDVEVSGAKSLVDSVAWAFGTVNAKDTKAGEQATVQVELQPLNDGEALVDNVRMSSQFVDVTYTIMDVKEVALVVPTSGDPGLDKAVEEMQVPKTIKIKGLGKALKDVTEIVTEPIDLASLELDETGTAVISLTPILPEGVELSRGNSSLEGTVVLKDVMAEAIAYGGSEISVVNLPKGMDAFIEPGMYTATVKAEEEVLDTLKKEDLTLEVDLGDLDVESIFEHPEPGKEQVVEMKISARYEKAFDQVNVLPETVPVRVVLTEEYIPEESPEELPEELPEE